jgi:predicted SnoaL-like aldol condensation-catalyzing enzyme
MKRIRYPLCLALASTVLGATLVHGAEGPAPDDLIHHATPQEEAARQVVITWSKLLGSGQTKQAFETCISKDFVEHSHLVRAMAKTEHPGYNETYAFFTRDRQRAPQAAGTPAARGTGTPGMQNAAAVVANDDIVTEYVLTPEGGVGVDIFRVKDGKITDHWDGSAPRSVKLTLVPASSAASGN